MFGLRKIKENVGKLRDYFIISLNYLEGGDQIPPKSILTSLEGFQDVMLL